MVSILPKMTTKIALDFWEHEIVIWSHIKKVREIWCHRNTLFSQILLPRDCGMTKCLDSKLIHYYKSSSPSKVDYIWCESWLFWNQIGEKRKKRKNKLSGRIDMDEIFDFACWSDVVNESNCLRSWSKWQIFWNWYSALLEVELIWPNAWNVCYYGR